MNKAPIVTIAIPAFNLARYIKAVIDYVLQKALQEWKILVFDCESCNTTREIVKLYSSKDPCARLLLNLYDKCSSHARSTSIRHACGDYVAFLESVDQWIPSKRSDQVDFKHLFRVCPC